MKNRILLVTNVFPPAIGGPAIFGARLGEALQALGRQVTVLCATPDDDNLHTYPFKVVRAGTYGNRIRRELDLRVRLLRECWRAELVYCMGLEHQTAWACKVLRKPYVLRIGGDYAWEAARNKGIAKTGPEKFYEDGNESARSSVSIEVSRRRLELGRAHGVIYVSDYMQKLARLWTDRIPEKEKVVPNGIVCRQPGETIQREDGRRLKLLFVGRQTNWKGVDAILLAVSRLDNVSLTVAGSGPAWPGNIDLAQRLDINDKVKFIGDISPEKMPGFMAKHHVLILPSLYEGLSNTLLEAGAAGLACIASNKGGNPEVIKHGETGLLVDPFDIDEITLAIGSLVDNDAKRILLAKNHSANVMTSFTMEKSIIDTIGFLEDTC